MINLLAVLLVSLPSAAVAGGGFLLTVTPPDFTIREVVREGEHFRRIETSDAGRLGEAGRPDLPVHGYWIGLPYGHRATARVMGMEYEDLPGPPVEPAPPSTTERHLPPYGRNEWYPIDLVQVGEPTQLRHQRVAAIRVALFRVLPASGLLRVTKRLVLQIDFVPVAGMKARRREPAVDDPSWESIYRAAVANHEQARSFRGRCKRTGGLLRRGGRKEGAEYKLLVSEDGLYRIDFSDLAAAGLSRVEPLAAVAIYRRGFSDTLFEAGEDPFTEVSLPIAFDDANADSLFNTGDALYAYLPGFQSDRAGRDFEDRFASENVFFLSLDAAASAPERRSAWRGYEGLTPLPSFPDSIRWEEDTIYDWNPPGDTTDLYFPFGKIASNVMIEIELPEPDTGRPYGIKAMTVSTVRKSSGGDYYHRYVLQDGADGDTVLNEAVYGRRGALLRTDPIHPGASLQEGINQFFYRGWRGTSPEGTTISGAGGYLDWLEIHAHFLYAARNDYLRFSTGEGRGKLEMALSRFSEPDVRIVEITDPHRAVWIDADSIRSDGEGYTVLLQDSVSTVRSYVASTREGALRLDPSKIVADQKSDIAGAEGDYLIITHDDFHDALGSFVSHRSSQGYRVAMVRVSDVYDEFNGGMKDPKAIRRFIRYGFERWETEPGIVLLVGDGYEDYKGIAQNAAEGEFDFIPSYPIYQRVVHGSGDHWNASDLWYVLLDGPRDTAPDLLIGRFPVGNVEQLETLVEKTIRYETENLDARWRRNVFFVADDGWTFDSGPIRNRYQHWFETESRKYAGRVVGESIVRADTTTLNLSRFTDIYHELCPYGQSPTDPDKADLLCVLGHVRENVTPEFFEQVNGEGAFLVNFQGHGSRSSLTHELFLVEGRSYRNEDHFDVSDRTRLGAPLYIFMGYGCSISEFERFSSLGQEAVSEQMLLVPDGGGVLTFGSTSIEFLQPNLRLNEAVLSHFYPPTDSKLAWRLLRGGMQRTAGQVLFSGLIDWAGRESLGWDPLRRLVILGDPALRIGPSAPTLSVTVDGEVIGDGEGRIGHQDGSPLEIVAVYESELFVSADSIAIYENGTPVADSLFSVEQGESSANGRWTWTIRYRRAPDHDLKDIVLRVADPFGWTLSQRVSTGIDLALTLDGKPYTEGVEVRPNSQLAIIMETDAHLDISQVSIDVNGSTAVIESLHTLEGRGWVAEARLSMTEGSQTVSVHAGGLTWRYTIEVVEPSLSIRAAVDRTPVENGHFLLGHVDGTPPEIVAWIGGPHVEDLELVRAIDGETAVLFDRSQWEMEPSNEQPVWRISYRPELRSEDYDITLEAVSDGGVRADLVFHVSLPLELTLDGITIADGDYAATGATARILATYPGEIPEEEIEFDLDGTVLEPDSLRKAEGNRWIASRSLSSLGGSHSLTAAVGAFRLGRSFRVESELRVEQPLSYPNPTGGDTGFFYHLTKDAEDVWVEIYTVAGRRIRVIRSLSNRVGYNHNYSAWDGRDEDGDRLARGVYPYRVVAICAGKRAEAIGKLVIGAAE